MATATKQAWTPKAEATADKADAPIKFRAIGEWANLTKVNDMSGKYQIDLTNISQPAADALRAAGIKVKSRDDKPEKGLFITPTSQNEIRAYDESGNEIKSILGNGTEVIATIVPYAWGPNQYGSGIAPSLKRLVVTKLVEYVAEDGDEDTEVL